MKALVTASIIAAAVTVLASPVRAQFGSSTDDLWDVSRGTVITGNSPLNPTCPGGFDARDIFGGHFSGCTWEAYVAIFQDHKPEGFVHFVEWATPNPVKIRSFNLWATGSENHPVDPTQREMAKFRLLAKSSGSATYDLILYTFTPSLPYKWVDNVNGLLISSDIKPVTAREFRAEFINHQVGSGQSGPRVIELDGFDEFIGPTASIRVSETEVSWESVAGLKYQVEYREDVPGSNWGTLGSPIVGDGKTMRVTDKVPPGAARRFYRVRATE